MTREELEKDVRLVGLMVFHNEVKHDSKHAIETLHTAGLRSCVCPLVTVTWQLNIKKEFGIPFSSTYRLWLQHLQQQSLHGEIACRCHVLGGFR